jgi:long-chain acyl-CoA synthetase
MREENLLADEAALARTMGFRDDDRLLGALPLSHSYGFTTLALSALVRGLTLVLPSDRGPFAPLAAARELGATIFPTVPAYFQALLKMSQPPTWPDELRLAISAGAVLPSTTAVQFRETYGQPVHVFYGSSECGGICYDREGGAAERGTVGTLVEGVRISLRPIDSDDVKEGLVPVVSAGVGETYLPDRDSRLGSGRFETNDVGAWQDGELVLRRRVDRVINLRGRKVDPSEVERVLAALDGVDEAVVIGVTSPGGGEEIVRAVVACAAGRLNYQRVAAWCRHKLADHKVPRSVIIVDAIPRTSRGKIDRAALLEMRTSNDPGEAHG